MRFLRITTALLLLLSAGCGTGPDPSPVVPASEAPPGRVALVGLDAATWHVLRPLERRGLLPALEALRRDGVSGPLETLHPTVSVVIWTTIATGVLPEKHGIESWTRGKRGQLGGQLAITSNLRRRPAIWNLLSRAGRDSLVVNWWASWPAEVVQGAVLSNLVLRGSHEGATWPPELVERIKALPRPADWKVLDPGRTAPPEGETDGPGPFLGDRLADDQILAGATLELRREMEPHLLALYFRSLDLLQHEYWDQVEPEAFPEREPAGAELQGIVVRYHRYFDRLLSDIIEGSDRDTTVALVSDHGMEAIRELPPAVEGLDLSQILVRLGLLVLTPEGDVAEEGTLARDVGRLPPGLVRTLTVHPGPDESPEEVRRRVQTALESVRTPGGRPLFVGIKPSSRPDEDLELGISPEIAPGDGLLIGSEMVRASELIRWIMHPRSGQHWHAPPGVVILGGERFRRGYRLRGARVQDMAPTLLWALDLPLARDLDGRLLEPALVPGRLATSPVRWVDGFDHPDGAAATPVRSVADRELMEELRSLGYVN